ncbi:PRC-barrel domain protein [Syntrophobotulus glycolicus DSM 8271]|uniref:PRC-barrel domain protein n=1 Tax=Syntrophobotulus glycolicus (strain DSM 8271 / FlGlyR) TaxID=645991 RepID=F0T0V7_SYNGF|nr:PRC-barrel domain-containing protein [Syntrophobotulus glycolicus]ADY56246.1 PRC-barrel domain protein [Syntrophobotulus glycolicus DSM 8271]
MRRIREIMGTPVLNQKTGAQMGHVKDLIIDDQANRLIGIILETDSLFSGGSPGILRQDLVQINDDFIVADCSGSPELRGNSWLEKSGGTVYNCDGTVKGCIVDVFLDEGWQEILGYELSDGLFADLLNGRQAILEKNILLEGKDVIVIEGG